MLIRANPCPIQENKIRLIWIAESKVLRNTKPSPYPPYLVFSLYLLLAHALHTPYFPENTFIVNQLQFSQ